MKYNYKFIINTLKTETRKDYHASDLARSLKSDEKLLKLWRKAENFLSFIQEVRKSSDDSILFSDFAMYYFGRVRPDWYYRREYIGRYSTAFFKTISEGGSLKIGTDGLEILVGNHYGDDINRVAIFDYDNNRHFDNALMSLFPYTDISFRGEDVRIYKTDYNDEVAYTLGPGLWHVYSDDRFFAIIKWGD